MSPLRSCSRTCGRACGCSNSGCGPGTITLGLATVIAPGGVVGVDPLANRLDMARSAASEQIANSAHFEYGDIHTLPFDDGSFDASPVHADMNHITKPVAALAGMRRVLNQGSGIGI